MELQLQNLSKRYGTKCAVDDVNVCLNRGYMVCLAQTAQAKQR